MSEKEVYGVIYVIENKINGKKYVGQTVKGVDYRFKQHIRDSRRVSSSYIHKAINKYGYSNFQIKEIDKAINPCDLNTKEIFWINKLKTFGQNGYNLTEGGENPPVRRGEDAHNARQIINLDTKEIFTTISEACEKYGISNSHLLRVCQKKKNTTGGYNWAYYEDYLSGDYEIHTPRPKIRKIINLKTLEVFDGAKGACKVYKNLTASGITACCTGEKKSTHGSYWAYYEDYLKGNCSIKKAKTTAIKVINLDTLDIFDSCKHAACSIGVSPICISNCCKGKSRTSKGYRFSYYNDYLNNTIPVCTKETLGVSNMKKVVNIDTKEVFESILLASKSIDYKSSGSIGQCCKGKKKTAGGYRWQYYEDYLKENT